MKLTEAYPDLPRMVESLTDSIRADRLYTSVPGGGLLACHINTVYGPIPIAVQFIGGIVTDAWIPATMGTGLTEKLPLTDHTIAELHSLISLSDYTE